MIKSKVESIEEKSKNIKYPVLMRSTADGTVVLFTSRNVGVVIVQSNSNHPVGYNPFGFYSCSWVEADDERAWRRLSISETVVLNNEE